MNKMVSCVIPSYKRCDTVIRAINSVLNQTYSNLEVLLVDDNVPGDEYSRKLQEKLSIINDVRLRYISQSEHINGAKARNVGIENARGEYIAFLDDDDEWLPEKIEKQMEVVESYQEYTGVSCLYSEYKNGVLFHSCPPYMSDGLHKKVFDREVSVFTSTVLLRRDKLLEFGGFDIELERHQDIQLLLDYTLRNKMYVINEYLVKLNVDSDINRPSLERLVEIKKDFFNSVSFHLDKYSKKDQMVIKSAHYYELAFVAAKEKKNFKVIKFLFNGGVRPESLLLLYKRLKSRKYKVE